MKDMIIALSLAGSLAQALPNSTTETWKSYDGNVEVKVTGFLSRSMYNKNVEITENGKVTDSVGYETDAPAEDSCDTGDHLALYFTGGSLVTVSHWGGQGRAGPLCHVSTVLSQDGQPDVDVYKVDEHEASAP